ncbi:glycosyl hydrolase family 18 protein [Paenibacillus agaridevorans]|uniref:glycosyl hydrolase family 18 protein n=1 Tax=Paenibacillus agaridevorans TaxID=171404 RepID=UPI001FE4F65C|nr:glycosyl hydrolase family 18 protein [Paenibacillus agaridevorans]
MYTSNRKLFAKPTVLSLCLALLVSLLYAPAAINAADEPPGQDPAAPQNLRIVDLSHNMATFEWDFIGNDQDPQHPNDIDIWDADTNTYLTWGNRWTHALGGLTPETTYRIYITWYERPATLAHKSKVLEFTTTADTSEYKEAPLTPPQNFKVSDISETEITFGWTTSPGATGYDLYMDGDWKAGVWNGTDNAMTYTIPEEKRVAGAALNFYLGAQDPANARVSANSNEIDLIWGELAAPSDLQVVTANRDTVNLGWAPVPGATLYTVYQGGTVIGTTSEPRLTVSGLAEGQSYDFTVLAANQLWESPISETLSAVPGGEYTNVTYYTAWSLSEQGRNFRPEDVDYNNFTHINYAFADLCWKKFGSGATACHNENIPLQSDYVHDGEVILGDADFDPRNFASFKTIKEENPHLKLLVSVGGWSWSNNFSPVAATELTRRTFANSAVNFIREYGLDGLDIDWEYPVEGGEEDNAHSPEDNVNFTLLMKTIREAFDAAGSEDGRYYLLTIASGQGDNFVVNADLANSSAYLDYINIMTYDYSGNWELFAHHNAPLYHDGSHPMDYAARNNVSGGAVGHLNGGVPAEKLVLGIPFYGKGWAGCSDGGQYGTCTTIPSGTWEAGVFDVADLENNYAGQNGYEKHWNAASKTAYLWNEENGTFITYNDDTSMKYNASFVKSLNLAGVMSWEVSGDRNRTLQNQLAHDLPLDGTTNAEALPAPAGLAIAGKSSSHAQLKWDAVDGAGGYEIFVNRKYIDATEGTSFILEGLSASTSYSVYVLAVSKDGESIGEVSPASVITVTTDAPVSYVPPAPPAKDKNELDGSISKQNGKLTISVQEYLALNTIKSNKSAAFKITADAAADSVEVLLPKAVAEAIADKGEDAGLTIIWGSVAYAIPASALQHGADIRITLVPLAGDAAGNIEEDAKTAGIRLFAEPIDFIIAAKKDDGQYEEITDFDGSLLKRSFTLDGADADGNRLIGVLYLPESGQFRPVATTATENEDGTITVELTRDGNSIYTVAATGFEFEDVAMDWARDAIELATASLLIAGKSETRFGAADAITRAEFVSMITRALGILPSQGENVFGDVDPDSAFAGDIAAAAAAGLIAGKSDGVFDPNGNITRQDMAVVLGRALSLAGLEGSADTTRLDRFGDRDAIAGYARDAAAWLAQLGILRGVSGTAFSPTTNVTRAQATVAVIRMLESLK